MSLTPQQRRSIVRARLKMLQDGTANRLDPLEIRPYKPVGAADPTTAPATGTQAFVNRPDAPLVKPFHPRMEPGKKI